MDPHDLCVEAWVKQNTRITELVMKAVAAALIDAGWKKARILKALRAVRPGKLEGALLEASGWTEICETYCDDILGEEKGNAASSHHRGPAGL